MYIPKISKKQILNEIDLRSSREYTTYVKTTIQREFNTIKNKLILNFENHPITREIDGGADASNTSGTLGGVGNLFSYIGFESNERPTRPIKNLLKSEILLTSVVIKKDGTFFTNILYPTPEDIFSITPLPWAEGRSWAEGIERGLSGFGQYLNVDSSNSRSGSGIQAKNNVRPGKFQNTKYITSLIRDFEKDVISLNSMNF